MIQRIIFLMQSCKCVCVVFVVILCLRPVLMWIFVAFFLLCAIIASLNFWSVGWRSEYFFQIVIPSLWVTQKTYIDTTINEMCCRGTFVFVGDVCKWYGDDLCCLRICVFLMFAMLFVMHLQKWTCVCLLFGWIGVSLCVVC